MLPLDTRYTLQILGELVDTSGNSRGLNTAVGGREAETRTPLQAPQFSPASDRWTRR